MDHSLIFKRAKFSISPPFIVSAHMYLCFSKGDEKVFLGVAFGCAVVTGSTLF